MLRYKLSDFQFLWRDLENIEMWDCKTVKDYYSKLKDIVNQLKA